MIEDENLNLKLHWHAPILSNCAYIQSEAYTHWCPVLFHLIELEHIDTSPSNWCSCPPLPPDRWWCEGGQCVLEWWMG